MPYRRRRGKRYGRRSKPRYTTWGSAKHLAAKAWKGVKFIKGLVNVEKHYLDTAYNTTVDSTGSVTLVTGVAAGNDTQNRNGNSILAKSLYFRYLCFRSGNNSSVMNYVRVMLVKDLENTGTAPTFADLLQSTSVVSPLNVDHTSRYQVMYDKVHGLSLNGSEGLQMKRFLRVNDHIKYTGVNSTDVYKNNIYLMLLSSEASNPPSLNGNWRLGFYDN